LAEKRAITHVKVQERLSGVTVVCCDIVTGRTHQIRVHLSEGGKTPVLGDMLYGKAPKEPELQAISQQLGRHWLHAEALSFLHPISKEVMRFESPIPLVLAEVLERLRSRTTDVSSRLGMTKR
jgi:23S rRNA pseudouridine1911/1915/1917 synthase